ncbi:S26 family signal peptidase [Streptomyces sp. NPDC058239]|uniref:S26 family signal peptidase n=1 Tax=Streptomyces sp. NPDC058239 TaxID=3346395 RepID=UPI0036E0EABA
MRTPTRREPTVIPDLSSLCDWKHALLLAIIGISLLRRKVVSVTIRGSSMEPAFRDGDRVLVLRGRQLAVGQVVVVERPRKGPRWTTHPISRPAGPAPLAERHWLIKRIAAVPGDPVPPDQVATWGQTPESTVPVGKLVLLGDNAAASYDSRQAGYFQAERVLGTVLFRSRRA